MNKIFPILILFFVASPAFANTTGYAWSESVGWFDFSSVIITDTALTGHAYNDNTGWLVLEGVSNTSGTLAGYAWSESVGYFDFSNAYIENGELRGYAYNDNTGWLSFEDDTTVTTTWAPTVAEQQSSSSGRSGSRRRVVQNQTTSPSINTPLQTSVPTPISTTLRDSLSSNPRDLEINIEGEDVKLLQQFLNQQGFFINTPGLAGSQGYETTYFGPLTQQALIKFQQANRINPSAGYFGPITRVFIKTLSTIN